MAYLSTAEPVCPPAPRKPRLNCKRGVDDAVDLARSALLEASADGLHAAEALQSIPRHMLRPVFGAYLEWMASDQKAQSFERLLEVAPCLDNEIYNVAASAGLAESWDGWCHYARHAACNPDFRQQLADQLCSNVGCRARRVLQF
eukprot:CAMPEP_0202868646 /NCGR_PEP_ID=MMETSP1391-20130828/10992_1 /ASSEMBLY_ACC=CAM_ASM_000867 /TAXON_ID=1034604 /ORGANISM="Chlamydomonas leiostraca, Strain SAG 11-49" /LENGTH=144 /DNA_ID=CAMNT_0049548833 /DNA_START=179 /DNA_END=613 /DNA_ORIENTATION=+